MKKLTRTLLVGISALVALGTLSGQEDDGTKSSGVRDWRAAAMAFPVAAPAGSRPAYAPVGRLLIGH